MNIDDVKDIPKVEPQDFVREIFKKQQTLLDKYQKIEGIPAYPFDLDNAEDQIWIKDFLWRICEEIAESMEANRNDHIEHQIEELSDALHFIVEVMILTGVNPEFFDLKKLEFSGPTLTYNEACLEVLFWAGLTGNTLKNKKWKQSQMQTDLNKFIEYLQKTLNAVLICFFFSGCTPEEIFVYYFKKSEVNKFRQRTKY